MLIVTALNITGGNGEREDGTADYAVEVAINNQRPIWAGLVNRHVRKNGAAALLELIAAKMREAGAC